MTKEEVLKLLVLIETVYSNFIIKDETIQQWFEFCLIMDHDKVLWKLKNHIRKSPFPPMMTEIAVFTDEEYNLPNTLEKWKKEGQERMKHVPISIPQWPVEYSTRKSV